jgi:glyoxylase-like metal-dependent hydrolase (beta-lactamase superfamily II)
MVRPHAFPVNQDQEDTDVNRTAARAIITLLLTMWLPAPPVAQAPRTVEPDLARLSAGHGAQVFNRTLTTGKEGGRAVARLDAHAGDGGALLDGVQLGDGVIEVDLRGKDVAQQSFLGIAFHVVDWTTYDAVYFRPFNFRAAGAEQRSHSVQYISQPVNTWQKLRAERPGQFEKAIEPSPDPNGWFHARIVLANSKVEVYVNNAAAPSLVVDDLGGRKSGGVALWAGNGSDGAFANLKVTATAPPAPPPVSTQTIFQASATGNLARLKALVEADPKVTGAQRPGGPTPLHLAAANGQRAAAEYLLAKGADVNAVARHSGTPTDLAYESDRKELVQYLESKGGRLTPLRFDVSTLTPAVHRIAFPWGMMNNVLVFSGSDGALIVDSGFSTRAVDELRKTIAGFSPAGVRYVVSSHDHGDHVAGNSIAPTPAAIITSATLAAPPAGLLITKQPEALKGRSGRTLPAGYTLRFGGADITLIPRPGLHSDADVLVYFPKESVVAMGDLLLSESVPAVADIAGYMAFLDDVLDVFPENTMFVSGHGRDLDSSGVRAYRDALSAMIAIVKTNLAAGRTAEQMVQDDVLKAYKAQYSLLDFLPPDTMIPRAVDALQRGALK